MPVDLTAPNIPAPQGAAPKAERVITGRFVLVCLLAFFAVVAGVNAIMITAAVRTFSGVDAGRNGYERSQGYNAEIAQARAQAALGWAAATTLSRNDVGPRLTFTLKDGQGGAVSGLEVSARLGHPSDRRQDGDVKLVERAPGAYDAPVPLAPGAWDVAITANRDGARVYLSTGRLILR